MGSADDSQLLRGILEGRVLSVIAEGETYGYLILSRLEAKKYIVCRREKSPFGPMRKYYSVTDAGLSALATFKNNI